MSFFKENEELAVSYLEFLADQGGSKQADFDYFRGGTLSGFGDAILVLDGETYHKVTKGKTKPFNTAGGARLFISSTLAGWAKKNKVSDSDVNIARKHLLAAANKMFR